MPLGFYLFRSVMILITFNHDSAVEALVKDNKELALKVFIFISIQGIIKVLLHLGDWEGIW